VISIRNFLRCLGGSIGLAVGAAVLQNVLRASLPPQFKSLARSTYAKPDYSKYSEADAALIQEAYARASRAVFVFLAPCAGMCLLTCAFVRDRGLQRAEEVQAEKDAREAEELQRSQAEGDAEGAMVSQTSLKETKSDHDRETEKETKVEPEMLRT
jgi:hypothetical protein